MTEIITIIQPDQPQWGLLWWLLIVPTIGAIISIAVYQGDDDGAAFGFSLLIGAALAILFIVFSSAQHLGDVVEAQNKALSDSGYSQLETDGDEFNAVKDGERVRGTLIPVEGTDDQFQVVIIPPVVGE